MRITIEHSEVTKGLVFKDKYFAVDVKAEFSEEEKAIIKKNDLLELVVMERACSAEVKEPEKYAGTDYAYLLLFRLRDGDQYLLNSIVQAQVYEQQLKEALKDLKQYLEVAANPVEKSTTFEL